MEPPAPSSAAMVIVSKRTRNAQLLPFLDFLEAPSTSSETPVCSNQLNNTSTAFLAPVEEPLWGCNPASPSTALTTIATMMSTRILKNTGGLCSAVVNRAQFSHSILSLIK